MDNPLTSEQQELAMLRVLVEGKGWTVADERINEKEIYLIIRKDRAPADLDGFAAGLPE